LLWLEFLLPSLDNGGWASLGAASNAFAFIDVVIIESYSLEHFHVMGSDSALDADSFLLGNRLAFFLA
jgi:hypothetical protein